MATIKESFFHNLSLIREEYKDVKIGNSTASYREHDDHIEVASVRTPQKHRGKGRASVVMKHINSIADEKKKKVRLLASPLDKKTRTDKLVGFYRKHGYETTGERGNMAGDPWMERNPK